MVDCNNGVNVEQQQFYELKKGLDRLEENDRRLGRKVRFLGRNIIRLGSRVGVVETEQRNFSNRLNSLETSIILLRENTNGNIATLKERITHTQWLIAGVGFLIASLNFMKGCDFQRYEETAHYGNSAIVQPCYPIEIDYQDFKLPNEYLELDIHKGIRGQSQ